ncbi:hypothetical protein Celaphus_00000871, partial [Cervus elaphus hippelaphus]
LAPLAAFNVDVVRTWVTPEGGDLFVLSSLLHQDSSSKQTWLLVTSPRTSRTAKPLHQCSLTQDELQCQPVGESAPTPGNAPRTSFLGIPLNRANHSSPGPT